MEQLQKSDLVQIVALWFNKKSKTIVIECEDGFIYEGSGDFNHAALGITDYHFKEVEIKDRHHIQQG